MSVKTKAVKWEAVLKKFVSRDKTRENLMYPWNEGDFTYATDGKKMIRIKPVEFERPEGVKDPPKGALIFDRPIERGGEYRPLPEVKLDPAFKKQPWPGNVQLVKLDARYVDALKGLPDLEYLHNDSRDQTYPVYVRFRGGEAILMPIRF